MKTTTTKSNRTIEIPVTEIAYGDTARTDHVLRLEYRSILGTMTWKRFGIGGIVRGKEGRKVYMGPMVKGPWAFAFGLATVIDNHGGTGREMRELEDAGKEHLIGEGDKIRFDGKTYRIEIERREFINLIPVRK